MAWSRALAAVCAGALLAGCSTGSADDAPATSDSPTTPVPTTTTAASGVVTPKVEQVVAGLENPWDLAFLPDGKVLVTQRPGKLTLLSSSKPGATATEVRADLGSVQARGEGGLMGLVLMPNFASSREFITCQTNGTTDIRLVVWKLSTDQRSATKSRDLLTGLPVADSGRHSGCRMAFGADSMLYVGTGDTANAAAPQDRTNLGGKVLRINATTGAAPADNPFASSQNSRERYVWTYGHRNVQGIAVRGSQVFSAEHGPDKNDEVNLLRKGANYGWDPSRGGTRGGYDEDVPMTDTKRFPKAVGALWSSGETTEAICAATFLTGTQWGAWNGAMVVTALKGAKLLVLKVDSSGTKVESVTIPQPLNDRFGRLRAARQGPDGALYVTTSDGDNDKVLRISPSGG